MGGAPRRRTAWCAAAVVLATVALSCGSTASQSSSTTTTTTVGTSTTGPGATCRPFGATGPASATGSTAPSRGALLRNVQVQASACVDEVSFLFLKGTPGWSVAYRDGPLTLDPSGQPATIGGAAHLVVRLEPASGVDLSVNPPRTTYDGPADMSPARPSGVLEVRRLGDFEGVTTWVVGLSDRRPFEVVARTDQIVVRLAAPAPRATACEAAGTGLQVGYPQDWYAELSPRWACRYFDPDPFVVFPATDATSWTVTAEAADTSAGAAVSRMAAGATVRSHEGVVAGIRATVLDVTLKGDGLYPAGYEYRAYVVATQPLAFIVMGRPTAPGPRVRANRDAVDRIAEMVTRR